MSLQSVVTKKNIDALIAAATKAPNGSFVEVGVYKGGTAFHLSKIAKEQGRKIYLYDTFEGIPYTNKEKGDLHKVGDFNDTSYEVVKSAIPYATVVKGLFPDSAVPMSDIAFVHVDCDQYQSIIDTVKYLTPLMVKGGIFWFDDAPDLKGALQAVNELFGENNYSKATNGRLYKVVD